MVSKSQRKREALETTRLAAELMEIDSTGLGQIPLDPTVRAAVDEGRSIQSRIARKRHTQYVGKLLRRIDTEPIVAALQLRREQARREVAGHHRAEAWRDRLLELGDDAVASLANARRDIDVQALRQQLRNARRQQAAARPPSAAREIYRLLRDADRQKPLPPID